MLQEYAWRLGKSTFYNISLGNFDTIFRLCMEIKGSEGEIEFQNDKQNFASYHFRENMFLCHATDSIVVLVERFHAGHLHSRRLYAGCRIS